jgi:hypothetical protein
MPRQAQDGINELLLLSTRFPKRSNGCGGKAHIVGQEYQRLAVLGVFAADAAYELQRVVADANAVLPVVRGTVNP